MREETQALPWTGLLLRALVLLTVGALALLGLRTQASAAGTPGDSGQDVRMVVPLGRAVGIKLFSDGVLVVGLSEVTGPTGDTSPARACGLRQGDIITHINDTQVDTIEEVRSVLQDLEGDKMSIRALRAEEPVQFTAQAVACADGTYRLGAWIRDSMAGIGTVTFYDPATGAFGALGHGITDSDTGLLMPLGDGAVMDASVKAVKKGSAGDPGELRGSFNLTEDMGSLWANTERGVFGVLDQCDFAQGQAVAVAAPDQVHTGPAEILSNISGDAVETFDVELVRVVEDSGTQNLLIRVTDPALIARTGGIVQGMSGSPILQDGRLVGAVTHVMIDDPTKGYGILIENMLAQAEKAEPTLG